MLVSVRRTDEAKQISMFDRNEFSLWAKRNLNDKNPAKTKQENTPKRFRLSWGLSFKQAICFILLNLDKDV